MLLATAEDCKEKSLKRLARDDDTASPLVSQSSVNKRQATSNKNFQEPENLKVHVHCKISVFIQNVTSFL